MNVTLENGDTIRPTMALVDDPQDRETAKSAAMVQDTIAVINQDVAGMGEAGVDVPVLLSGNCMEPADVMAHYLASEDWKSLRVPSIETWPDGWDDPKSECRKLWAEWWDEVRDDPKAGAAFYLSHRAAMVTGLTLTAPNAVKTSDTTPDAEYHAVRQYHKMGHAAFWAERQQQPIDAAEMAGMYRLDVGVVLSRVTERQPGEIPDWSVKQVAACDVNPSYGVSWLTLAMGKDQTAAVLNYGIVPCHCEQGASPNAATQEIYRALIELGRGLKGLPYTLDAWVYDARGWPAREGALRFRCISERECGIRAIPTEGWSTQHYRPWHKTRVGQPFECGHEASDIIQGMRINWLAWNSDHWKEVSQRAWTCSPDSPGACSLPTGPHGVFAAQVVSERLLTKQEVGSKGMVYDFRRAPSEPHDFGDALAMAYMVCASRGIGTGGAIVRPVRRGPIVRDRAPSRVCDYPIDERSL